MAIAYTVFDSVLLHLVICMHGLGGHGDVISDHVLERSRRQASSSDGVSGNFTVDVLFVADFAVYQWFYNLTEPGPRREENTISRAQKHYSEVIQGIRDRYKGIDTDRFNISVQLVALIVSTNGSLSYWTEDNKLPPVPGSRRWMVPASLALDSFLLWVNQTELPKHDHAFLFTGYNLTYGGSGSYRGLSYPDSICSPDAISVVEDTYNTVTSVTTAQELGRSLGSRQDLDGNFCLAFFLNVMTPETNFNGQYVPNLWKFSSCSIKYFEEFLEPFRQGNNCLKTQSSPLELALSPTDSADQQCRNVYGEGSFVCRALIRFDYAAVCQGLPCWDVSSFVCRDIIPYDGTVCGNFSVCSGGICTSSEEGTETRDDCPYGDQPIIPNSAGCDVRIYNRPYDCYRDALRAICCQTCEDIKTTIDGCEYGDRIPTCNSSLCSTYNNNTRTVQCCLTCTNGKAPFSVSTIVPMVTTSPTYVTSGENVTLSNTTDEGVSSAEPVTKETTTSDMETEGTTLIRRSTPAPPTVRSTTEIPTTSPSTTGAAETTTTQSTVTTEDPTSTSSDTMSHTTTEFTNSTVSFTVSVRPGTTSDPVSVTVPDTPSTRTTMDVVVVTLTTDATTDKPDTTHHTSTSVKSTEAKTTWGETTETTTSHHSSSMTSSKASSSTHQQTTHSSTPLTLQTTTSSTSSSSHQTTKTTPATTTTRCLRTWDGSSSGSSGSRSWENSRTRLLRARQAFLAKRAREIQKLRRSLESRFRTLRVMMSKHVRTTSRRLRRIQDRTRSRYQSFSRNIRSRYQRLYRNFLRNRRRCNCVIRMVFKDTTEGSKDNVNDPYT